MHIIQFINFYVVSHAVYIVFEIVTFTYICIYFDDFISIVYRF